MFVLLLTIFIDLVGFGIIPPLPPFHAQAHDTSPVQITLPVVSAAARMSLRMSGAGKP